MVTGADARPVIKHDRYLPIEDHGLIGDGSTCALAGQDGAITGLCLPEFDSPPFLAGILDAESGGRFEIAPVHTLASSQRNTEDSCVLVTSLVSDRGVLQVTDGLTLRAGAELSEPVPAGRSELLRWGRFRLRQHPQSKKLIDQTVYAWRRWASSLDCEGSQAELMKRSALTLKMLDHAETGAILAAATSSLPEWPGTSRNWDYRYTWVIDFDDPRMVSTTKAIAAELDAGNGLLFRYLPGISPDGLPGSEGAFLLCSRANPLGLLPEQIHPDTGEFLGNFPQALSHVGVLASGLRLLKAERRAANAGPTARSQS
ncbi:glycoside hydrolase family 15 protein [Arthrobacter sp. 2RAF6]|uniref:glycoside hydrolase family 15 protein n=1 Tax=Arthrobacter sp. 2RAF6 TaxID=3233002 RepID=UPI003F9223F4